MKHLKKYKLFESKKQELEDSLSIEDIQDIFIELKDNNLYVDDCKIGSATSMKDALMKYPTGISIITDPDDFDVRFPSIDSLSVKLKTFNNDGILMDKDFFNNLKNSIGHMESQFKLEVNSIFYRTHGNLWVNSVDALRRYLTIKIGDRDKLSSLKNVIYIDIIFEIL